MRVRLAIICLVLVGLASAAAEPKPVNASRTRQVLVLTSHGRGLPWAYRLISAVQASLLGSGVPTNVEVHVMHTRTGAPDDAEFDRRGPEHAREIRALGVDVIVAIGEDAYWFVSKFRPRYFADAPVIFSGISMTTAKAAAKLPKSTVISMDWNMKRDIELIRRLWPSVRHVVFVYDNTSDGRAMAADARALAAEFPKLKFEYLNGLNADELLARIRRLPRDSVLVPLAFTVDRSGKTLAAEEAVKMMADASPVPVIALWGFELDDDATGGLILDEKEYGKHVAQTALEVASGADVGKVSVDKSGLTRRLFDHRELEHAGVSEGDLPPGSTVVHTPPSVVAEHRAFVLAVLSAIVFLTGVVAMLIIDAVRRKKAARERIEIERRALDQMRRFYRETILSVTGGKLEMCDPMELEPLLATSEMRAAVGEPNDVPVARNAVRDYIVAKGLDGAALDEFVVGVGEAMNNAVKHAPDGVVCAGTQRGEVWVAVSDDGSGIDSLLLPRVALQPGFTTKGSLGMGYTIMLDVADRVLLATDEQGTTVVLVKNLASPAS